MTWELHPAAVNNAWTSVAWSPELDLFVAVASFGDSVMTSPDGVNWTAHAAAGTNNEWRSVTWSSQDGLFVAVGSAGNDRVMTSNDGITWTARTAPVQPWWSVTWSPELDLFVAVSGTELADNQVMTSPDGITWTERAHPNAGSNWLNSVTWSPDLDLFVAVAGNGTDQVMTSPDGITWTARTADSDDSDWQSVTWSPELDLFVAVAAFGDNQVMTSPDGITWTARTADSDSAWKSVAWSPTLGMFVAVAQYGATQVMTSPDGITWASGGAAEDLEWNSIVWSPDLDLFVAVSAFGSVMTNSEATLPGSGTVGDPYQISDCEELQNVKFAPTAHFVQTADIDCSASSTWNEDPDNLGTYFGFSPIGSLSGSYDGQGHDISDLYINRSSDHDALFRIVEATATVQNVALVDVSIFSNEEEVGSLVGYNYGTIENSSATGSVTVDDDIGGGLVGINGGTIRDSHTNVIMNGSYAAGGLVGRNEGTIENSYALGSVTGEEEVGGLVGDNEGSIVNSYATGVVAGDGPVGGLVGENSGPIEKSYATGNVTAATGPAGGLAGGNYAAITDSYAIGNVDGDTAGGLIGYNSGCCGGGAISRSYSIGSVTGTSDAGGLVGSDDGSTATESFWNTETSGQATSPLGTGKTTAEMKDILTFSAASWSIQTTSTNLNNGYPFLSWQAGATTPVWLVYIPGASDGDGIADEIEDAGPNGGDANNDGTPDSDQAHVVSFVNPAADAYAVLEANNVCTINTASAAAESANAVVDSGFNYPVGLMSFILDCGTSGYTTTVTQYYYGVSDDGFVVRKHNPNTNAYFTVTGAALSQVTIGGQTATKVSYQAKDGADLDVDGVANGTIVDPVGLAQSVVGVPNTGLGGRLHN